MKAWRWLEKFLLVMGLLAIDVWIWSHALQVIYTSWQDGKFEQEVSEEAAPDTGNATRAGPLPAPKAGGTLGRLSIPRLRLHAIVREGDGESTLSLALGHIPNTALPGQIGNVGVAGHRDTILRSLRSIRKNDVIVIETRGGNYIYRVEAMKIVKPEQVSVLKSSRVRELTLVTCYPFRYVGPAPDRFIVKARQVTSRDWANPPTGFRRARHL